jgi:hypothetical protein
MTIINAASVASRPANHTDLPPQPLERWQDAAAP